MSRGLPLVAIGGTLCDARVWSPVLARLHRLAVAVTAGRLPSGALSATGDMVGYVSVLLDQLPPRFALAGYSLGGLIALEITAQAPDRVCGLALVCAGAGPETEPGADRRRADELRAGRIGMAAHAAGDIWPRFGATDDDHRDTFVAMAGATGPDLYRLQNDLAVSRVDSQPRLGAIGVPVLLVTGVRDPLCPPARHDAIAARIPHARRLVIDRAGHMACLERPGALVSHLGNWLADVDASRLQAVR